MSCKNCPMYNIDYSPEAIKEIPKLDKEKIEYNGGKKYDQGKSRLDLIPSEALEELGKVLAFGARKYEPGNWANGINYSRLIAASLRHISAFNSGEDLDPESGLCHIDHAMCNLVFLSWMRKHRADLDDRWIKSVQKKDVK